MCRRSRGLFCCENQTSAVTLGYFLTPLRGLPQIEIDFDVEGHVHGHAIAHAGPEAPLLEGLNGILIETEPKTAHDALDIDGAVSANNGLENNGALIASFAGLFGILRLDALQHGRRSHAAANVEHAAAKAAAFTGADARPFAVSNTSALAGANTVANARSGRRRSRDAVRVSQGQQINSRQLRPFWSNDGGFDDQCGVGILRRLRIRRRKLLFSRPRQFSQ